mgnify:CR=1 FL=1
MDEIDILKRALRREKLARKQAEFIMETKSLELFSSNTNLLELNRKLEAQMVIHTEEIAQKEIEFTSIVEGAIEIIVKLDVRGNIKYANPATTLALGYSEIELIGSNFSKLIRSDYLERVTQFYFKQLNNQIESTSIEFPVVTKKGREMWLNQIGTLTFKNGEPFEFVVLARDTTKLKLIRDALKLSEEKYRGIIENLELGIMEVDVNDKIVKAYPQFCKLTGYSEEELIGKSPNKLLVGSKAVKEMKLQNELREEGESGVYEVPIRRKDGTIAWVVISGAPFYDVHGKVAGTVGLHLDISKSKQTEYHLRKSKQKTEKLYKEKELFMANMSHEIRTPMNAIIGMAELLEQSKINVKQEKYVSAIRSSSKNLLVLINDLLDFSKIESGKLMLEIIPFNLKELIVKTKELLGPKADENGVHVIYDIEGKLSGNLMGDPTRLGQVLINLVGNAVKFTTNGNVYISVTQVKRVENMQSVRFEIRDEGIGISESERDNLFENFTQANQSTARMYGGTGLGLAISQKIVALMGGELGVTSKIDNGSTFYFTLELEATGALEIESNGHNIQSNFKKSKILVVEDNSVNVLIAKTILENWNCVVDVAQNGVEAIEKLSVNTYSLVLMDMRMPVMGGMEATRIIRNKLHLDLPVIALTGNAIKGDQEKCLKAGMNDYLSKPFEQIDLNIILTKWVDLTSKDLENLCDLSSLKEMGDPIFIERMVDLFMEETTKEIILMEEAVLSKNIPKIKSTAHKLKPSVKYVCIDRIYHDVLTIENWNEGDTQLLQKTDHLISDLRTVLQQLQDL